MTLREVITCIEQRAAVRDPVRAELGCIAKSAVGSLAQPTALARFYFGVLIACLRWVELMKLRTSRCAVVPGAFPSPCRLPCRSRTNQTLLARGIRQASVSVGAGQGASIQGAALEGSLAVETVQSCAMPHDGWGWES
jgi:hypothetical protein